MRRCVALAPLGLAAAVQGDLDDRPAAAIIQRQHTAIEPQGRHGPRRLAKRDEAGSESVDERHLPDRASAHLRQALEEGMHERRLVQLGRQAADAHLRLESG